MEENIDFYKLHLVDQIMPLSESQKAELRRSQNLCAGFGLQAATSNYALYDSANKAGGGEAIEPYRSRHAPWFNSPGDESRNMHLHIQQLVARLERKAARWTDLIVAERQALALLKQEHAAEKAKLQAYEDAAKQKAECQASDGVRLGLAREVERIGSRRLARAISNYDNGYARSVLGINS